MRTSLKVAEATYGTRYEQLAEQLQYQREDLDFDYEPPTGRATPKRPHQPNRSAPLPEHIHNAPSQAQLERAAQLLAGLDPTDPSAGPVEIPTKEEMEPSELHDLLAPFRRQLAKEKLIKDVFGGSPDSVFTQSDYTGSTGNASAPNSPTPVGRSRSPRDEMIFETLQFTPSFGTIDLQQTYGEPSLLFRPNSSGRSDSAPDLDNAMDVSE